MARIGIDTGGTFTDLYRIGPGGIEVEKLPSTPDDPGRAVREGLARFPDAGADRLIHGTTVATNALLTRSAGPVAFVVTAGFRDLVEIGRQDRPDLYALEPAPASTLTPRRLRFEVRERTGPDGEALLPLDEAAVRALVPRLAAAGVAAVAVGFLHAYASPRHERRAAAILRKAGFTVSASHEVLAEHREFERFSTTLVNAYVAPAVSRYLGRLARAVGGDRLSVMQSNGGIVSWRTAAKTPARTVLSGPAGGVAAALAAGRAAGMPKVVSFDMGGTSTDVALADGELRLTTEFRIGGLPVALPVLDVHTVGAGGGSIARIDAGGALVVGPESAGAVPGPAAYGRGGRQATVSDAHVVLGRIRPELFLGGAMALHPDRSAEAIRRLASAAGMSPVEAALGVLRVCEANMERAIRVISLERGHDPADFTLVAFGGAGGLHAAALASSLGMAGVLVPPHPGAFSAAGMAAAAVTMDDSASLLVPVDDAGGRRISAALDRLRARLGRALLAEGVERPFYSASLDLRYAGQSFELAVPLGDPTDPAAAGEAFHALHELRYGVSHAGRRIEAVAVRLRGAGPSATPAAPRTRPAKPDPAAAAIGEFPVVFREGEHPVRTYARERLRHGHRIPGPAIVVEPTGTTLVPPGFRADVDRFGNLRIAKAER